ncbi:PstS family phosphate ABC transporter substrate-binding protein [Lysinibacillus sphaericus]|uniref:Phosphate ABC transporter periplasmic protein n=1 Tax=Lysinibacillus sphaericus OT4b.31 TaxID=1285586 RepID=R7ZGC8_LYSSH|nr:PstS family phosphate ABC transporter substrate-binding protein [Lysinibacillus sphaericus]EON73091.1 phosphate ABC transporter periplasmic protein [Lysinibacillus sphaericus OT4b.31]
MKIMQTLFVFICLLFFAGIVAFITLLNGLMHYKGLLLVVPISLFLLFTCLIFEWFTTKKRKAWFAGIIGVALVIASIAPIQYHYKMKIPTVDAEIDVFAYEPFVSQNKVVKSQGSLQLEEPVPRIDGATAMYPLYAAFVEATYPKKSYPPYESEVMVNRTPVAYHHLIEGDVDLIFAAAPSESQQKRAEMRGLTLDMVPIGREAFVFFVHHKNNVDNLTLEQVKRIYAGEIPNWREVGGDNIAIRAFQRPADSGSQTTLEKIMEDTPIMEAPTEDVASGMGDIIHEVSKYRNYKNAIGYTFRYYSTNMVGNKEIKLLSIDGVAPTKENIRNGTYPLTSEFYAVTVGTDNPNVTRFVDWIISEEGQTLVDKVGYVPVENF